MLLTLLQSRGGPVPPPTPSGGGGTGAAAGRRTRGWMRERTILEASLAQFEQENLRRIGRTMADSDRPQAQRIARKLVDYTGDLEQIRSLQREIGKLQAAQAERIAQTQAQAQQDSELRAAAAELRSILLDEEDTLQALMALEDMEARHLLGVLGISVH